MTMLGCAALLFTTAVETQAASVRVRCETRLFPPRSKISIDGSGLAAGDYKAVAKSGTHRAVAPLQGAVGDEVEFDFDSNPNDILEGATAIGATFIQNNKVVGKILDSTGAVVARDSKTCRVR
jgi:hypothetical protein